MWCKHKEDCIAKLRKTTYEERVTLQVNSAASGGIRRTAKMKVWKENSPIMSAGPRSRFTMQLIILRADSMGADQRGLSHRQLPNLWHM
jgi:hypothetical protein